MSEAIQYGKFGLIGSVLSLTALPWPNIMLAVLIGFFGALGGFLAKLVTNYLSNKIRQYYAKYKANRGR